MHHAISFQGETLHLLPSGALFLPHRKVLCASDLHMGKAERLARRGGTLLPPYETRETLARLDAEIEATTPAMVVCLGDSFDDAAAADGLDESDRLWLTRLMAGRDWIWIQGNHDAGPIDIAGTHRSELTMGSIHFRHIATPDGVGEISGHYHPKLRLAGRAMRCFLMDRNRIVLPAFGTYTGGLWAQDPSLCALFSPQSMAFACGKDRIHACPMPRASTNGR